MYKIKLIFKFFILMFLYPKNKRKIIDLYDDKRLVEMINNGYSLGRYGDGEISLMAGNNIGFQKNDKKLSKMLYEALDNYNNQKTKKFIIGMPKAFNNCEGFLSEIKIYWLWYSLRNKTNISKLIKNIKYANANITRPYIDYKKSDYKVFEEKFNLLRKIWNNKDIIFVEGEFSKLGVGNDLFDNAKSIKRIICPNVNAFEKYYDIYNAVLNNYNGELILLALGPTATILSYELSQNENIHCVDIGHIDIEYLWYLKKTQKKESITGKYVNESFDNNYISDDNDKYKSQIIDSIKR